MNILGYMNMNPLGRSIRKQLKFKTKILNLKSRVLLLEHCPGNMVILHQIHFTRGVETISPV